MVDAFVLGLTTGVSCISTCFPFILPLTFAESNSNGKKYTLVLSFLAGRLIGYVGVGFILGAVGAFSVSYLDPYLAIALKKYSYIAAGIIMFLRGLLLSRPGLNICKMYKHIYKPGRSALALGVLTGFSLCPPFFAAAARVFGTQSSVGGAFYFFFFYLGTTIWFLPLLGAGYIRKHADKIQLVSRMAMVLIGAYFVIFMGILESF